MMVKGHSLALADRFVALYQGWLTNHYYADDVVLFRLVDTGVQTLGVLRYGGFQCYTLERPWRNNATMVSCIPPNRYDLKMSRYNKGGYETMEIINVPDRTDILFHKGNLAKDTAGCVLVGTDFAFFDTSADSLGVTNSQGAFSELREKVFGIAQSITIIPPPPSGMER